ncbi:MAG TPA: hypothetical protein VKI61_10675 [Chitinophagaceae bacterium]|jgi:hypothetical protein|nr:hypothetical protein [Chitinophagaceae bacterium]
MFAKIKSPVFIDSLHFEVSAPAPAHLKAVLRDDKGSICGTFETKLAKVENDVTWRNLNDLPYGVYTMELSRGTDEMKVRLVKRV